MHRFIQSQSVMRRLVIIFSVVAAIIIFISGDVIITLQKNSQDGLVINVAGRQRMLTKKFASEVLLELHEQKQATNPALDYRNTVRLYETSLNALKNGGGTFSDLVLKSPITLIENQADGFKTMLSEVESLWLTQKQLALQLLERGNDATVEEIDGFMTANHKTLVAMHKAVLEYNRYADNQIQILIKTIVIGSVIGLLIILLLSVLVSRSIVLPLGSLVRNSREISRGDLEHKPYVDELINESELGNLASNIDKMRHTLSSVVKGLKTSASGIVRLSDRVTSLSDQVNASKSEEESRYQIMTQISHELIESTDNVSNMVTTTLNSANDVKENAAHGLQNVKDNIEVVERATQESETVANNIAELSSVAAQVYSIIDVIQGIAEQTNLLALNAAIEAARAGDQGRGFAVVADEVRVLASKTNDSTAEIADLLNSLTEKVETAVSSVGQLKQEVETSRTRSAETADAIEQMSQSVAHTVEQQNQIASLIEHQVSQLHELQASQQFLTDTFLSTSQKISDTTEISAEMREMAAGINMTLDEFTYSEKTKR
ncbi:methyl-accepting chemotaxis protein [Thaumasiovibrio subtropicus]|uniref:methyl-accepting chemotaxis protein n=1 Tax=Thaumasiovibrio subtropicus TaxID=1891207 RepID=UPI000B353066|nr:methyl-accepting chemotaxis protein [Thaumasiovibrio subtropicus]